MKTEMYEHHGKMVHVNSELKGKHRELCLCWSCSNFEPSTNKCPAAAHLYKICVENNLVTIVCECSAFKPLPPPEVMWYVSCLEGTSIMVTTTMDYDEALRIAHDHVESLGMQVEAPIDLEKYADYVSVCGRELPQA